MLPYIKIYMYMPGIEKACLSLTGSSPKMDLCIANYEL